MLADLFIAGLAAAFTQTPQALPENGLVHSGLEARTAVAVPRVPDAEAVLDGVLDEPAWQRAAVLTGFSQYRPLDGVAAADSTEVLVWYDSEAIHFGVRAFEAHAAPVATLADRDRIDGDDHVRILLDTFNDRRRALLFAVNPLGIQADGVWNESASGGTSLGGATSERQIDLSPDFLFHSRGMVTPDGWQAEVRIPFESLRYQPGDDQTWGLHVMRIVQHSGHQQSWSPARQAHASFLAQAGTLEGLTGLRRGLVVDINPVLTARTDGARTTRGNWAYDGSSPEPGVNMRWSITENLTLNATANPDFSQVESDAGQLAYDPRQTLSFSEKRPFFLEASENFLTPNNLVYTRSIVDPIAAAKFTGKISDTDVGALIALDGEEQSARGHRGPLFSILRVRRDLGSNSSAGFVATSREDGTFYNRVVAADARIVLGRSWTLSAQAGASFNRDSLGMTSGRPVFQFSAARQGREFGLSISANGTHPGFVAGSGFVSRPGNVNASIRPTYTIYGAPGATIESWTGGISLNGAWNYHRFVDGRTPNDPKLHFNSNFTLRGGWRLGTSFLLESFLYPPELYANYFIDAGADTLPYSGTHRITNYDFLFTVNTPQFRTLQAYLQLILGRDENFQEWAPGYVWFTTVRADWRPTEKLRTELNVVEQRYYRPSDFSIVARRRLPRMKIEYQLSRPIFLRLVGEYRADVQDDLRDDTRTDLPILLRQRDGTFVRATAFSRARFGFDALFSYQPNPGTVLFVGYGNGMSNPDGTSLADLQRIRDGFFIKLSYNLRL